MTLIGLLIYIILSILSMDKSINMGVEWFEKLITL